MHVHYGMYTLQVQLPWSDVRVSYVAETCSCHRKVVH
jgi:hypothetical protein